MKHSVREIYSRYSNFFSPLNYIVFSLVEKVLNLWYQPKILVVDLFLNFSMQGPLTNAIFLKCLLLIYYFMKKKFCVLLLVKMGNTSFYNKYPPNHSGFTQQRFIFCSFTTPWVWDGIPENLCSELWQGARFLPSLDGTLFKMSGPEGVHVRKKESTKDFAGS